MKHFFFLANKKAKENEVTGWETVALKELSFGL